MHAVLTFDDLRPLLTQDRLPLELRLELLPPNITPFPLAKDEVVFVGEAIAVVIADIRYLAEDAAMLVAVEYDPLAACVGLRAEPSSRARRARTHARRRTSSRNFARPTATWMQPSTARRTGRI